MAGLVRMYREEGFAGFMKGNGINVVRVSLTFSYPVAPACFR